MLSRGEVLSAELEDEEGGEVLSYEFWVLSWKSGRRSAEFRGKTQHSELSTQNSAKPSTQHSKLLPPVSLFPLPITIADRMVDKHGVFQ